MGYKDNGSNTVTRKTRATNLRSSKPAEKSRNPLLQTGKKAKNEYGNLLQSVRNVTDDCGILIPITKTTVMTSVPASPEYNSGQGA
jgi:hypothetical protein